MLVHNFDCCISRFPGTFNCVDAARKKVKSSHARLIYIDYDSYIHKSIPLFSYYIPKYLSHSLESKNTMSNMTTTKLKFSVHFTHIWLYHVSKLFVKLSLFSRWLNVNKHKFPSLCYLTSNSSKKRRVSQVR